MARSSSATVTVRSADTSSYSPPAAVWVSVTTSSAPSVSCPALTVTVWAVSQSSMVKVRVLVALRPVSVRSVSDWPETVTVTSSSGSVASITVYVTPVVSPSTSSRDTGVRMISRSSSVTVTGSVAMSPSYSPPAAVCVSVTTSLLPSSSSPAVTITVCAVFQVVVVKVSVVLSSVRSVLAWPETVTVTFSEGWVASFTV